MCHKSGLIFLILFIVCVIGYGTSLCTQGSYLNLCGVCVGGITDKNELDGLDRCGICGGQSDCVGCDGIINSPRRRDSCGLCLLPQAQEWNDCLRIDTVYPSLLELSLDNSLVPLTISGAGLKRSYMNTTQCLIQPLESQPDGPVVKETSLEDDDIQIKIQLSESVGTYRIGCSEIEGFVELQIVDSRKLNALKVEPEEVLVDENVEVEIELEEDVNYNITAWCFVRVDGGGVTTMPAVQKSNKRFKCSKYMPLISGILHVGVVAHEETAFSENRTGRAVQLSVRAKPPVAEIAEYTHDFQHIVIHFDQNVQIRYCNGTFSRETEKYFGNGFICKALGDTLRVTLGEEFDIADSITITSENDIRRSWSGDVKLSPSTAATTLPLSKEKVKTSTISLSLPNTVCADPIKQPSINVSVYKLGGSKANYIWSVPPLREWKGRNQRENMLMWKKVRAVEAELCNLSRSNDILLSRSNLLPGVSYEINVRSSDSDNDMSAWFTISETGNISVTVKAFPSASAIVAEVSVTFCNEPTEQDLKYKWSVDGNVVMEDGKLLYIRQTSPGMYNISCAVLSYKSGDILGVGWTTVKVVSLTGSTVLFPTETVVGTIDDIVIQAYSRENQWRWSCSTSSNEPCLTVGPKGHPIDEVININTSTIRIPAGTLPVGKYIWTLYGNTESKATVIISPRIPPILRVAPFSPNVDASKPLSLNANIERLKSGCRIRWKLIRRKGYDYFDLQKDVGLGDFIHVQSDDLITEEREIPLVIPTARKHWNGLVGGAMYLFRLETVCPDPTPEAHVDITVVVNSLPKITNVTISPETGEAINTKYRIELSGASDNVEDYPLFYHFSIKDESKDEILLGTSVFAEFAAYLPPGNVTITIKACNIQGSCSTTTKPQSVSEPTKITTDRIKDLISEIRSSMICGDTITAYATTIVALKGLSTKPEYKQQFDEISSATESAIKERIRDLSERLRSSPKMIKQSYEFLEQSVGSLKYFPETKDMVKILTEFKNQLTQMTGLKRRKRHVVNKRDETSIVKVNENTIKAIFDLHAKILEQNNTESNREDFLKDVRKYMFDMCDAVQDVVQGPISIESSLVTLEVMKLHPNELKNNMSLSGVPNMKVKFNLKSVSKKTCAAIAKYKDDFISNSTTVRVSDIFEIRLIKNGSFMEEGIKSVSVTIPIFTKDDISCFYWNDGWKSQCTLKTKTDVVVNCGCKNIGIYAAFLNNKTKDDAHNTEESLPTTKPANATENSTTISISPNVTTVTTSTTTQSTTSTTITTSTKTIPTTTTSSTVTKLTTSTTATTVVQNVTVMTTQNTTVTTEKAILASVIENIGTIRDKNASLYISGTFTINEDYTEIVGKDVASFKESLRKQLAEQLKVKDDVIANLIIKPGSIIVTVLFVDSDETKAETAIKELVTKLHDGKLKLIGPNEKVLNILPQHLKMKIGTNSTKNTGKMRLIAYGVVAGTFSTILLFALGAAYLKRKRTRMPLRLPHLSIDDHPNYRQFHNELSLDGSSASLARYRRTHPFETESTQ